MSTIFVKGEKSRQLISKIVLQGKNWMPAFKHCLNSRNFCIVCGNGREIDESGGMPLELVKHHVSYFPELIAYVHYSCHKKIHDTPLNVFIQYSPGDSRRYYARKPGRVLN